jgi:beta-lactam-binding protein with PASTA domain/tetratricopeptide (TPR) repeat protein
MSRKQPAFALSMLLLFCLGLAFLLLVQLRAKPAAAQIPATARDPFALIKTIVVGGQNRDQAFAPNEVTIIHDGNSGGAQTGMMLYEGDEVTTGSDVKLTILFLDNAAEKDNEVQVFSQTHVQLGSIFTWAGKILAQVKDTFAAKTTRTQCSVVGTEYELTVDNNGATKVLVLKGEVKFETGSFSPTVAENHKAEDGLIDGPRFLPAAFREPELPSQQKPMEFVAVSGKIITIEREFILTNSCAHQHLFQVAPPVNLSWFQFMGAERFAVAGHGSRRITFAIKMDATHVPPGVQEGQIVFPCLDCKAEPACAIGGLLLPITVNVVGNSPSPTETPSPTPQIPVSTNVARMQEVMLPPAGNLRKSVASVPEVDQTLNWSNEVIIPGEPTYSAQSVVPRFRTAEERNQVFREVRRSSIINDDQRSKETLADIYVDWGNGAKAEEELKRLGLSSQETPERLTSLGESYRLMGDLRTAEQLLQRALSINPGLPSALNALGNVYLDQAKVEQDKENYGAARGYLDKAQAEYERALRAKSAEQNHMQSSIARVGQTETVAQSNLGEVHLRLGEIARNQGRSDEALRQYQSAEQAFGNARNSDQTYQFAYTGLGDTYRETGETLKSRGDESAANSYFVKSRDHYARAVNLHNDMAEAYVGLGRVLDDTGNHSEARKLYLKATQVRPELPDPHYYLAVALAPVDPRGAAEQARAFLKIERVPFKQGDKARTAVDVVEHRPVPQQTVTPAVSPSDHREVFPTPSPTPSPSASPSPTPSPSPLVQVPHMNGDKPEKGLSKLNKKGLEGEVQEQADCKMNGRILSTNPGRDQWAPKGSKVIIFISGPGPNAVTVPQVTNMQLRDAERELRNVGLQSRIAGRVENNSVAENTVLDQNPKDGKLPPDCQVELTISIKVKLYRVPKYVGLTKEQALQQLPKFFGTFTRGSVSEVQKCDETSGRVVEQHPFADDMVPRGTAVDLVIARCPDAEQPHQPEYVDVPYVVGMNYQEAKAAIENRGLIMDPSGDTKYVVTSQEPTPQQGKVPKGRHIKVWFSVVIP